jgi:serine/threonine protein kinase/Leucine-rich repeat (LRR) protein
MTDLSICASRDELQRMVLGQLGDQAAARIEKHLERCPRCWSALDQCVASDEFLEAVRDSRPASCEPTKTMYLPVGWIRSAVSTWIRSHDSTQPEKSVFPLPMAEVRSLLSPPQSADEMGRIADFRVLRVLGIGGMAVVFEAEDNRLARLVALKLMLPAIASKPGATERFLREARSAAALKHEHVVTIYQVGTHDETPFIALELLHGETLEDYLLRNGRMSVRDVVRIGREIAMGLTAAHARGLLHRDIKPANIWLEGPDPPARNRPVPNNSHDSCVATAMVESRHPANGALPAGKVKILDFGCAKSWTDESGITYPGLLIGTPSYMAPEQLTGNAVDPRTDLFSLGCLLYRMAGGRPPFGGDNLLSVVRALALEEPAPLRALNPDVPRALSDLITDLLSKSPDHRPPSAQAVADQLQAIEQGLPPDRIGRGGAGACSTESQAGRGQRTKWAMIAVVGLAFLLPLVSFLFGAQIIRIATNNGLVVIKIDDPTVEVSVRENHIVISDRKGQAEITLTAGEHQLEVTVNQPFGETAFTTDQFTLNRGGRKVIEVREELQKAVAARTATRPKLPEVALKAGFPTHLHIAWSDPNVSAAKAVLSAGGTVEIRLQGAATDLSVKAIGELPPAPFLITAANLASARPPLDAVFAALTNSDVDGLVSLDLSGASISDADWPRLKRLSHLRRLLLEGTVLSGPGLEQLGRFTNLDELVLSGTQTTDAGLAHLRGLKKLTSLTLDRTPVTDAGLKQVAALPALKYLLLRNTAVTDVGLKNLEPLTGLQSLVLEGTRVSDAGLISLRPLTELINLSLANTAVTDAGLKHLQGLTKLESLWLAGTPVTGSGLIPLKALKNLHLLILNWTGVSDAALVQLEGLPQLVQLGLRGTHVTDAGLAHLRALTKLRILNLSALPVTDAGLDALPLLNNLEHLDLDRTRVTDAGLLRLNRLTRLDALYLGETGVTEAGLNNLQGLKNLHALGLQGLARVSDAAVPRILHLQNLREVDLRDTHVSAKGFAVLKGFLPKLKITWSEPNYSTACAVLAAGGRVDVLLEGIAGERQVKAIGDLPPELFRIIGARLAGSRPTLNELLAAIMNPRLDALVSLDLSGTPIGDADVERLKPLVALQRLNLGDTRVTDAGLAHLKSLAALRRLVLDGDAIRGPGLVHLQELPELTELRLGSPPLTELFLLELAGLKKLERLSLAKSPVSDQGAKYLAQFTRLKELDLSDTQITAARVADVQKSLPHCHIITTAIARQLAKP